MVQPSGSIGVMGHVIANYPNPLLARKLIDVMVAEGVRMIEIQIPFSEPMADGPTFMVANHAAVKAGVRFKDALDLMREVSEKYPQIPFLFMSYANVIFNQGYEVFVEKAKAAGARGAIIPDLPFEMATDYLSACEKHGFANVVVIPPNIEDARLADLCRVASGLVYAVARAGVTGSKSVLGPELDKFLARIRAHTRLPVAVGFGIQNRDDVLALQGRADIAVIGSQGLRVVEESGLEGATVFWRSVGS